MNKIIIISLALLITGCNSTKKKEIKDSKNTSVEKTVISTPKKDSTKIFQKDTISKKQIEKRDPVKYDYDYIKSQTQYLYTEIKTFYRTDREGEHIPVSFLKKYLFNKKISIGFPESIPSDYPNAFVFKHFKKLPKFNLFTFAYSDESCCTTLYGVTSNKDSINVIDVGVLSYTGGDGGWSGEKYGNWLNDSIFKAKTISNFMDEIGGESDEMEEDNNNIEIDTIWSTIKINHKGFFSEIKNDSVKYMGTKKQY